MLKTTPYVMPAIWHGNYIKRQFIFGKNDLTSITAMVVFVRAKVEKEPFKVGV